MQASNPMQESSQASHWLDVVESSAIVASIGGSIVAIVLEQIALASVPLALSATLNFVNRRRQLSAFQDQQRLEVAHMLQRSQDDLQAELGPIKQASEQVQSQIEHLTKQDTQAMQTLATLTTHVEQVDSQVSAVKASQTQDAATLVELQTSLAQLNEFSTQVQNLQGAIAQLQSSTSTLDNQVQEQQSSSQYLAAQTEGVEELMHILREIDVCTQTISANPNDASNFYQRGLTRKRLQRLEDQRAAMDDFSQAINLAPTFANAYYERGLLKSQFGHKQHAVDDLRTAAKFYFDQGKLDKYEEARSISQEIHDLIAGNPSPEEATEQYLIENLFG